jgi:5-methylcytosine-specific restriction endonuclease McrA
MNFAKAQIELKEKFPNNIKRLGELVISKKEKREAIDNKQIYHKYDFNGEIRTYKNKLTLGNPIYLGETTKYIDHWAVEKSKPIMTNHFKQVNKLTTPEKINEYQEAMFKKHPNSVLIFTRKNRWFTLTKEKLSTHPYKGKCCYCEIDLYYALNYTRDHIIPKSKGGKGNKLNLKKCCSHCNSEKGNLMLATYIHMLNLQMLNVTGQDLIKLQTKIKNANLLAKELENSIDKK